MTAFLDAIETAVMVRSGCNPRLEPRTMPLQE